MLADENSSRSKPKPLTGLLLGLLVGIDQRPGLLIGRGEHGLVVHALPGLALFDVVILHLHYAGLGPLAAWAISPVAHDRLEGVLAVVVGDLVILDALGTLDRLTERAEIGIAPAAEIIADRIDALGAGARLILV